MKTTQYLLSLRQPVIISEKSASVGAHQGLDYIKGSTLLGLLASRLYSQLSQEDAFLMFHSGKVRFNDALPVDQESLQVAYPVPMCLHSFKAEKYADGQILFSDKIFDISQITKDEELKKAAISKQPVQLRNFYITMDGQRLSPNKELTLKTAIDPKQNRAKDAQLFGYEALSAHQQFSFSIQADDDVPDHLIDKLSAVVGKAQLGRSRSAQFGAVEIKSLESDKPEVPKNNAQGFLTLWLLSDLQLQQNGQPTLIPSPEVLGLPKGTKWLAEKSFLRSRRYSMYNAYRRHYDKERQVISRGSILRYELPSDFSDYDSLYQKLSKGIGLQTECGLGQVSINPDILSNTHPTWKQNSKKVVKQTISQAELPQNSTLISVLLRKQQIAEIGSQPRQISAEIFNELCAKITQARRFQGLVMGMPLEPSPPSRTQFGRLKELANQYRANPNGLWKSLVNNDDAMLKVSTESIVTNRQSGASYKSSGWEVKFAPDLKASLGQFLQDELKKHQNKSYFSYIVAELAILGLSDVWEDYCTGKRPTATEMQEIAIQRQEQQ